MRIDVRSRTLRLSLSLRSIVERRVSAAFASSPSTVDSVLVILEADGSSLHCRMDARGPSVGPISAEDTNVDAYSAVHGALQLLRRRWLHSATAQPASCTI